MSKQTKRLVAFSDARVVMVCGKCSSSVNLSAKGTRVPPSSCPECAEGWNIEDASNGRTMTRQELLLEAFVAPPNSRRGFTWSFEVDAD